MQIQDDLGHIIRLSQPPRRIISTVPSLTELLAYLKLDEEVIGITKFCIHPENWFRNKTRIGGTKKLHIDKIKTLNPDIIIANKEENTQADIEQLKKFFPVFVTDINNYDDALRNILNIGKLTNRVEEAEKLVADVQRNFEEINHCFGQKTAAYLIWKNPYMTVGSDTYIHSIMTKTGLQNVFSHKFRYPETSLQELQNLKPDLILLSSEPYPFKEKDVTEMKNFLPDSAVVLADGEMFSWYGSRMLLAPGYFKKLRANIF
ncbi:MAG: cobalamin-binding protein [Bacteroidetes bacterium]|nr:MAG: cobalamin-binding protein [Bacteroidota bacterium]